MKNRYLILSGLLLVIHNLFGQLQITPEEARAKAIELAPEMQQAAINQEIQRINRMLDYDFGMTEAYFQSEKEKGNPFSRQIEIAQKEMDLLGIPSKRKLSKKILELSNLQKNMTRAALIREVSQAWAEDYCRGQIYMIYKEINRSFNDIVKAAKGRYKAEATSKLDLIATQNESFKLKIDMEEAWAGFKAAQAMLNKWMGADSSYTARLIDPDLLTSSLKPIPNHLDNSLIFDISKKEADISAQQFKVAKMGLLPKINLGYHKSLFENAGGLYGFEVGISIPLPLNGSYAQVKKAKYESRVSALELQKSIRDAKAEYSVLYTEFVKWQTTWEYYKKDAMPLAKEQNTGSLKAYKAGEIDYTTFLLNIRDALQLEVEAWMALESYLKSYYSLEYFISTQTESYE